MDDTTITLRAGRLVAGPVYPIFIQGAFAEGAVQLEDGTTVAEVCPGTMRAVAPKRQPETWGDLVVDVRRTPSPEPRKPKNRRRGPSR